jgi:hypothetical protein
MYRDTVIVRCWDQSVESLVVKVPEGWGVPVRRSISRLVHSRRAAARRAWVSALRFRRLGVLSAVDTDPRIAELEARLQASTPTASPY